LATAIGERVRQERHTKAWSLDQLAEASGVSRRLLISVEQGAANPSVATLLLISDALGVGLPVLVAPPSAHPVTVTREGEGATLWKSPAGGRGVLVAGTQPPHVLELWDWTLYPGDTHGSEAHAPGTMELLHMQRGSLTLTVLDETLTLAAGDAVAFRGDVPHSYTHRGTARARFSLAVFEPGVGTTLPHSTMDRAGGAHVAGRA
jgi:transcriptional regulator with XRE-family HTH domain